MTALPATFPALLAGSVGGSHRVAVGALAAGDLPTGDVTVRVAWSSVNYKDGLAASPDGKVARIDPLAPGIDLAGEVVASDAVEIQRGQRVLAHGHELGAARHGGYAQYARVPAGWIVPLPDGLSSRDAMTLGTAGFTAGLSLYQLEHRGLRPADGPVLVTGASGGVGSTAVGVLAAAGYEVVASTGKADAAGWLRRLGAADIIGRDEVRDEASGQEHRPLRRQRWAAAVDCVGGDTLAGILAALRYGGAVAASGLTGGPALATTVFPFVLRGVALLGVDSAECPADLRRQVWQRLASQWRPAALDEVATEVVELGQPLIAALQRVLAGGMRGRTLVRIGG